MRIDKYLKITRLIKRRTIAKEILDNEKILVNDKLAKPSTIIKVDDIITLFLGNKKVVVRVKDIKQTTTKDKTNELYEVISSDNII